MVVFFFTFSFPAMHLDLPPIPRSPLYFAPLSLLSIIKRFCLRWWEAVALRCRCRPITFCWLYGHLQCLFVLITFAQHQGDKKTTLQVSVSHGLWHVVVARVAVWQDNTVHLDLVVDGQSDSSGSIKQPAGTAGPLTVGGSAQTKFVGDLARLLVFESALSNTEINQLGPFLSHRYANSEWQNAVELLLNSAPSLWAGPETLVSPPACRVMFVTSERFAGDFGGQFLMKSLVFDSRARRCACRRALQSLGDIGHLGRCKTGGAHQHPICGVARQRQCRPQSIDDAGIGRNRVCDSCRRPNSSDTLWRFGDPKVLCAVARPVVYWARANVQRYGVDRRCCWWQTDVQHLQWLEQWCCDWGDESCEFFKKSLLNYDCFRALVGRRCWPVNSHG